MVTASGLSSIAFWSSVLFRNMWHRQLCVCCLGSLLSHHQDIPLALPIISLPAWKDPCQEVLFKACTQYLNLNNKHNHHIVHSHQGSENFKAKIKISALLMWVADDNCKSLREISAIFITGFYLSTAKYKIHEQVKKQDLWPGAFFWTPLLQAMMQHIWGLLWCWVVQLFPRVSMRAPFPAWSREGQQGLAISVTLLAISASEAVRESWPLHVWQVLCS